MGATIQLFEDFYSDQVYAPDKINIDTFNINDIKKDFVISRTTNGQILSTYQNNIWDLKPYRSNPSQHGIINFETRIYKDHIDDAKKIMFLLLVFGSGRNGSQYSVETMRHYFNDVIMPLSDFANKSKKTINEIFENERYLYNYIKDYCTTKTKTQSLSSLLIFLDRLDNQITSINYKKSKDIFTLIRQKSKQFDSLIKQTELIPSRILFESIKQRWGQIEEIENNLNNLMSFFEKYIESERFASSKSMIQHFRWNCDKTIVWEKAVNLYHLNNLFEKYNVKNRRHFQGFLTKIQGTCKHLLHAYTGMRNGELLNAKSNCLKRITTESGICRIISTTSKFTGTNKSASWVTTKEIERIIFILNSINRVIANQYGLNLNDLPLFIYGNIFIEKEKNRANVNIRAKRKFGSKDELPLDYTRITISLKDKQEIEEIDFNKNIKDLEIGKPWKFKTHQYRRSLAVYSIQSGLVSLGALQIQLKHLFREMTLYYSNGASYARKLFDVPKEHIANDFDQLKPELDTLAYIKNVIFSDEKLFGSHGNFVEKNTKKTAYDFKTYFFENRNKTLKLFINGEIAYKETALGACIATEACDSRLTRSMTACFDCHGGILKKSKIDKVIKYQKEFINSLDKNSIEYRTELDELKKFEELRNKLIKD